MIADIRSVIESGDLPDDKANAIGFLLEDENRFTSQEGQYWDFKHEWPFSYSDNYFGGIARLICAFANSGGGMIIFGVHDGTRLPGHNKVIPNVDRLQKALDQLLTEQVTISLRRYETGTPTAVDVLLVHPLKSSTLPTRFKKDIGPYKARTIWVRQGHEVIIAEPKHVPLLYCRSDPTQDNLESDLTLGGLLPPSSATVKKFVGRLDTIDRIFGWLKHSDEPRTFLYGKGGSGKTTIAYQIAKVLKSNGAGFVISDGEALDNVIFVSSKQKTLNTVTGTQSDFVGLDFSTDRELYQAILSLGNWTSADLSELSLNELKEEIRSFFDTASNFVVIDDIDTLTTKGQEAGFDFLYGVLWRAKRKSKILYTLRNAPSHSLANAIEVPGLSRRGEFEEFVTVCCAQFRVNEPDPVFRDNKLAIVSEQRPLVIESIIALRRNSGNYDRAIQLFEESSGDDVRRYVFQREWDALPADNYGRYVLAILSLYGEPLSFADLAALTRYDESRITDAIADIREMFLRLNEVGSETTYEVGNLTRAFVAEESKKLDHYAAIRERVEKYKKSIYPENPLLTRLRDKIEGLIERSHKQREPAATSEAWKLASDRNLSPKISEDPRFLSLQGYVAAKQVPPKLDDARRFFNNAFLMKSEPEIHHLRSWFNAERHSGFGTAECIKIANFVQSGRRYSDAEKIEFLSKRAIVQFVAGRDMRFSDPGKAVEHLRAALKGHLSCLYQATRSESIRLEKFEEYSRNTAYVLFDMLTLPSVTEDFFQLLQELQNERNIVLDPLEGPLGRALGFIGETRGNKADLNRLRGRLDNGFRGIETNSLWQDSSAGKRISHVVEKLRTKLANRV
ncbi:RNA-binding domain-containing protein [Microvirga puerhi]|uniref:DNA binding domain-containing protein n=1 Tax=Microvirga puerhi TaxID=2876078 RepID=A0ABS7VUC2_9HYPH|nr:RNA-binding domain-containing protein [Microvirga puerhi]MBZ6079183.1 putative DNA binding domain-containing protein [Microvirga puerhi]